MVTDIPLPFLLHKVTISRMRSVPQTSSVYLTIILVSTSVVLNPIVASVFIGHHVTSVIYFLLYDFAVAAIAALCYLQIKTQSKFYLIVLYTGVLFLPIVMGFVELTLTHFLGFISEEAYEPGAVAQATEFIANPNLFQSAEEAQTAIGTWPLQPATVL